MSTVLDCAEPQAPEFGRTQLGMWVFLASEMLFFGVVLVVWTVGYLRAGAGFAAASAHTHLALGTVNTALLLTSSCAMAIGAEAATAGRMRTLRRMMWSTVVLGLLFLLLKALEYRSEWHERLFPGPGFALGAGRAPDGAELFFQWYYFATALHAVHLLVGIAFGALLVLRVSRLARRTLHGRVHAFALYWHFVDAVWVLLYPLIYLAGSRP